jgi:putative ABC transport system permease protein
MLGASLAVLLATLAVAMAARQFASGQTVTVAVLQTLGQTGPAVVRHYFAVFLGVGVLALLAGVLLGTGLANLLFRILSGLVEALPAGGWLWPGWSVLGLALLTVLATLFGFALPQLLLLQKVSPMLSLREAAGLPSSAPMLSAVLASSAIFGLLLLYTRSLTLVLGLLLAVACVVLLLALFGGFGLRVLARFLSNAPQFTSAWRQSLSRLSRHRVQSLTQGTVLALSFLLFALMWLARDSLIEDWQTQLPADAPNHFLINIAPDALTAVRGFLQQHGLPGSQLHPIVRGRLSHINGVPVSEALSREVGSLNRELNLTWMDTLPEDNRVVDGQWPATAGAVPEVSVEVALAQRIGLVVGDRVTFTLGGTELTARIGSLRTVQWDSMRPNFYVIFRPGALEPFPMTYLTAFHLAPERKSLLNHFNQQFPTVTVLELDQLIARVQGILRQASTMLALMLGFVLLAALSVVVATACSGLHNRRVEAALLRTLGATRGILMRSQLYEFGLLGLGAGVLAVLGAELAMWQLQYRLFEAPFVWHPMLWWQVPLAAGGLCLVLGWWLMREVPATPPLQILRRDR